MPGREFQIRPYRPGDEHEILRTFNRVFADTCGPSFRGRTAAQWKWQYLDNPEGHRITLAVGEDGTVASQYAGVPVLADTPWGCMRFVQCVDSMTHPDWQQGLPPPGLFARTGCAFGDQCLQLGEGLCYGFPVDSALSIGRHYLGYEPLGVVDYLLRSHDAAPLTAGAGIRVRRLERFPASVDQLYDVMLDDKRCLVRRDHRYLRWRYVDSPERRAFELFGAVRGDSLRGILVLRREQALVPDAIAIAELMTAEVDGDVRMALLAAAVARQQQLGTAHLLAVFAPWSAEWRALAAAGFAPTPSARWLQRQLVHSIHSEHLSAAFLQQHWWFTLGDSDFV